MRSSLRPIPLRSSLGLRFALAAAAIFLLAAATLFSVQRSQARALGSLLESETRERSHLLEELVDLTGQALRDFTSDYSQWDEMVAFLRQPKPEWAAINLDASIKNFKLSGAWVLRLDGTLVHATAGEAPAPAPSLPLPPHVLAALLAKPPARNTFVPSGGDVLELCLAPIVPSADTTRSSAPLGWLLAGRIWDRTLLEKFGELVRGKTSLGGAQSRPPISSAEDIGLRLPLAGPDGSIVAFLDCRIEAEELKITGRQNRIVFWLLTVMGLVAVVLAIWIPYALVLRPLRTVSASLAAGSPGLIQPLVARTDELGLVAQSVRTVFAQKAELKGLLDERTRLGRDLHDGVIQTVFAAGMNLAAARRAVRTHPGEAERILEETRVELNASIRELRSFIDQLEPEPIPERPLPDAIRAAAQLMQGIRTFSARLDLDPALTAALGARQRLNVLGIVREALSNSARHSSATEIRITLRSYGSHAELVVADDGTADSRPTAAQGSGRGMENIAARAKELGGELAVENGPRGGFEIRVWFPI
ncbi:MAG: hypothetical protein B9S34_14140 [Opitutia bacterium Tous-C1TDCM]|nr:MAG: hypothetical protein B9S34_14140 [Opitutae bacterium Tous-C1TDCM]